MPSYEALFKEVLDTNSLQSDESTIGIMGIKSGKIHTDYMCLYRNVTKRLVLFQFARGRAAKYPIEILIDYHCHLQVDGYSAYEVPEIGGRDDIILLYCHAHTRRYFVDYDTVRSNYYISEIGKVYAVESQINEMSSNLQGRKKWLIEKYTPNPFWNSWENGSSYN